MKTERVRTGIKAKASFDENLDATRSAILVFGYERVRERLDEMKVFYWVKHSMEFEDCDCLICNLIRQCEYDQVMARIAVNHNRDSLRIDLKELDPVIPYNSGLQVNRKPYRR